MPYSRRIVHYSPGPADFRSVVSDRAVEGCWFELHRQGGCGAGELRLKDTFVNRHGIDIGDWIACDFEKGDRWYLGRVESREATSPAGVRFRLEGMGVQLNEAFPGGFGSWADDLARPHRYARTDLFSHDPDRSDETVDSVDAPHQLVELLMEQYVAPRTHITIDEDRIETASGPAPLTSFKFRGEESVRSVIKEAAVHARGASWGVDETGTFFFLRNRSTLLAAYREGKDLISLEESRDREFLFNRILLTGGYVYDEPVNSEVTAQGIFRWRGNYIQPASRDLYGERRIRLWVPWIRTRSDARQFVSEFFRIYAQPTTRYLAVAGNQSFLPKPWEGTVRIEAANGTELATGQVETLRVQFDHAPRFRMEIGPDDPRTHWPEPPHDERWEVGGPPGERISLSEGSSSSSDSSNPSSEPSSEPPPSSAVSSGHSSEPLSSEPLSSDAESSAFSSSPTSEIQSSDADSSAVSSAFSSASPGSSLPVSSEASSGVSSGADSSAPSSQEESGVESSAESLSATVGDSSADSAASSAGDSSDASSEASSAASSSEPLSSEVASSDPMGDSSEAQSSAASSSAVNSQGESGDGSSGDNSGDSVSASTGDSTADSDASSSGVSSAASSSGALSSDAMTSSGPLSSEAVSSGSFNSDSEPASSGTSSSAPASSEPASSDPSSGSASSAASEELSSSDTGSGLSGSTVTSDPGSDNSGISSQVTSEVSSVSGDPSSGLSGSEATSSLGSGFSGSSTVSTLASDSAVGSSVSDGTSQSDSDLASGPLTEDSLSESSTSNSDFESTSG